MAEDCCRIRGVQRLPFYLAKEQQLKLSREETYLLEQAQEKGFVTSDVRDEDDPMAAAYQAWCRSQRRPFLHIGFGEATHGTPRKI